MPLLQLSPDGARPNRQLAWFAAWTAVTIVGACLHPNLQGHGTHEELGLPPCPTVLLFDRPCPGCGLTTSWTALIHGQIGFAFHAHPLGPILYAILTGIAGLALYGWINRRELVLDTPRNNRIVVAGMVVFVAFGLVRAVLSPHYGSDNERTLATFARLR